MDGRNGPAPGDVSPEDAYVTEGSRNYEAAREEEARYSRYLEAVRMTGAAGVIGEGHGLTPDASASDYGAGSFRAAQSFRKLVESSGELEDDDVEDEETLEQDRQLLGMPELPVAGGALPGIDEDGEEGQGSGTMLPGLPAVVGGAAAGEQATPLRRSPFAQAAGTGTSHLPAGMPLGADSRLTPASRGGSRGADSVATNAAVQATTTTSRRLSDVLGKTLSAGQCEKAHISLPMPPVRQSVELQGAGGDLKERKQQTSVLSHLAPDQQIVLTFSHISSWVQVGNYGTAAKKPLKEVLRPSNLAGVVTKPFKDAAASARKGAASASSTVSRAKSSILRLRSKGGSNPDVEMGMDTFKPRIMGEGYRQILHNITGRVRPGEVLALMGPSGSGKTSLLSILGGRAPPAIKLDGLLTVNGQRMNKSARKRIGFVLQDDVLYESLTVRETLEYAGLLRLPRTMTREEKMGRVGAVIDVLGLTKSRDTIIGGYFRRGISGGERKRVSVGHELLINPAVLLLDEPTSGLDSTTALHLVNLLRELAAGGRAILTTIHQPSSRLYRQLDRVMLLAEGHIMYYGDALRAVDWFDHLGFGLPYGTNLADHILDCAMGEVAYDESAPGAVRVLRDNRQGDQKDRSVRGNCAVRSLYATFEAWYAEHPEGFVVKPSEGSSDGTDTTGTPSSSLHRSPSGAIVAGLLEGVRLYRGSRRSSMQGGPPRPPALASATGLDKAGVSPPAPGIVSENPDQAPETASSGEQVTTVVRLVGGNNSGQVDLPVPLVNGAPAMDSPTKGDAVKEALAPHVDGLHARKLRHTSSSSSEGEHGAAQATAPALGAPWVQQVAVLWRRAVNVRRFESLGVQQWVQILGVAFITGLLWWQRGRNNDLDGASDILGLLFFELLFVSFRSLFSALFTFPNEYRLLTKERPSGMYKLSAYYIARTLADLPVELFLPTLYAIIIYFFGGLRLGAGAFFSNWASLLLVVLCAQSWGLLVGALCRDPKTGQTIITIVMLTFMLVGGFYVRDVPVWISWIRYLSFVTWGYELFIKIQFRGTTLTNCAAADPTTGQCPVIPSSQLQDALRLPVDPNAPVWPDVIILFGMLFFLRWVTYVVLKWKTSLNQKAL